MTSETDTPGFVAFERALTRLTLALAQPPTEWVRDAAIQRFEFTVELAWKAVARQALQQGLECVSPRQAFRTAFRLGWIPDDKIWLEMVEDRNVTSHTYNEAKAEELFQHLPAYQRALTELLTGLKQMPDPFGDTPTERP